MYSVLEKEKDIWYVVKFIILISKSLLFIASEMKGSHGDEEVL